MKLREGSLTALISIVTRSHLVPHPVLGLPGECPRPAPVPVLLLDGVGVGHVLPAVVPLPIHSAWGSVKCDIYILSTLMLPIR